MLYYFLLIWMVKLNVTIVIVTIMILQFVDRQYEMQTLNRILAKKRAALVLLYGRRRVGKLDFFKNS